MPEERWVDNHEPSYSKAERSLRLTSRKMSCPYSASVPSAHGSEVLTQWVSDGLMSASLCR